MRRKDGPEPIVVGSNEEWEASINKGARDRWWWTLKREGEAFAAARTGLKSEEEATERALFLLHAVEVRDEAKWKNKLAQVQRSNEALHRQCDEIKRERDDARVNANRMWWAVGAAAVLGCGAGVALS